jgi:DNA modification methylase
VKLVTNSFTQKGTQKMNFYRKSDIPEELQQYFEPAEIGLEQTPDAYVAELVAVFREVRRVLADDGTLWLNLGDSYSGSGKGPAGNLGKIHNEREIKQTSGIVPDGLKPKDLIGIPWSVATALRDPYYTGRITRERDRAWIAAMIDGEGTICGFHHVREDGSPRTGVHITITNSSALLLDEAHRIWPTSRSEHQRAGAGHLGTRTTWRWIVHGAENKMLFLREVYPYLVAKKRQAMVAYNLLLMVPEAKRVGHSSGRDAAREKRAFLVQMLSDLNQGRPVDLPSWLVEPPSVFEPGYYLRQDIVWSKPNPMPESVRDRCTKAHEYVFLLSKSARYYFDQKAVAEPVTQSTVERLSQPNLENQIGSDRVPGKTNGNMKAKPPRFGGDKYGDDATDQSRTKSGNDYTMPTDGKRNKRSVWTVATQPYKGAHFATFPPKLISPMILAGCPVGGTVLDPFGGSGTTGEVAEALGRNSILIELNPAYIELEKQRTAQMGLGL